MASVTGQDWDRIHREQRVHRQREYRSVVRLLESLEDITDGFSVNQLQHVCQAAHLAIEAEADDEMVAVALLHDVAKPVCLVNHPAVAAEMLKPYLSESRYRVVAHHGEFLSDLRWERDEARKRYSGAPWWPDAVALAEWDAAAFAPGAPADLEPLLPYVGRLYGVT